jgi:hypothetical protein
MILPENYEYNSEHYRKVIGRFFKIRSNKCVCNKCDLRGKACSLIHCSKGESFAYYKKIKVKK